MNVKPKPKRRGMTAGRTPRAGRRRSSSCTRTTRIELFEGPGDRADGNQEAQADQPRPALRDLARPRGDHARPSPRSRSWRAKKTGGRNSHGRVTSRHRGGGAKRKYRKIDFKRRKDGIRPRSRRSSTTRTAPRYIALLHYADGEKRYILAPARLKVGDMVSLGPRARTSAPATRCRCANIPTGTVVHNVELKPGRGGQLGRSAGAADPARGEGGRLRDAAPPLGRDAAWCSPSAAPPSARSATPSTRTSRSARPAARGTRASARRPRHGDEPGRPPARRRRGLHHAGRHPSPRGACRRSATAPARRTSRRTATSSAAVVAARRAGADGPFGQEGPVRRGALDEAHRGA